jgi:hypothetical protein
LPATSRNRPATKAIRSQVGNLIGFMRRARAVHQAADDPISRPWRGSFDIKPTRCQRSSPSIIRHHWRVAALT